MSAPGPYVYAVVPEDTDPAGLTGVGSPAREPRAVRAAGLAARVGPAPAPPRAKRRDLLAHQGVLDALAARPRSPLRHFRLRRPARRAPASPGGKVSAPSSPPPPRPSRARSPP
ncbi:GvpL/GvpF family gas vesicle protein [Streptomyces evansiae]|uniref:GvpL/GvpF family gas vesicle protein n=1 Tax=Streptomyces evansiae TaxID=3075535 RepID=UPI002884CE06|nr:GvpL/GvpF family gas vesicle protein [Streptomyces sp. DSM 41859]MDT0420950.1 GvpL/GvpF family gas vesicle protein [Streptomyces sp. DSM 41859]